MKPRDFSFSAAIWLYPGAAAWHFVSVPEGITKEIDFYYAHKKHGFGSLRVTVTIGETTWDTSIFPDKKTGTYLLPLKKSVRDKEHLSAGKKVTVAIKLV